MILVMVPIISLTIDIDNISEDATRCASSPYNRSLSDDTVSVLRGREGEVRGTNSDL